MLLVGWAIAGRKETVMENQRSSVERQRRTARSGAQMHAALKTHPPELTRASLMLNGVKGPGISKIVIIMNGAFLYHTRIVCFYYNKNLTKFM